MPPTPKRARSTVKAAAPATELIPDTADPSPPQAPELIPELPTTLQNDAASLSAEAEKERRITRTAAARFLGISVATLRRAEKTGEIPHSIDADRTRRFSLSDLRQYGGRLIAPSKRMLEGERDAAAFALFEKGETAQAVTIRLKVPFGEAQRLHREWSSTAGLTFTRAQLDELESLGVAASAAEIIQVIRRLRDRLREVRAAQDRPRSPGPSPRGA